MIYIRISEFISGVDKLLYIRFSVPDLSISLLVSSFHGRAPQYLTDLLLLHSGQQNLHAYLESAPNELLCISTGRLTSCF